MLSPRTPAELAEALGSAGAHGRTVLLGGAFSKCQMAGPIESADVGISTVELAGVLQYEPNDLTVSVLAGTKWSDLAATLAARGQAIPLDPPFAADSTVGGVVAANLSGPRRRLYGTARDFIIGMEYATLAGKLVRAGGMVVKNVAGLDMAKLMIGSFGTLAAIAKVNFKVVPETRHERSFLLVFPALAEAVAARNAVLRSVLQPSAIDLLTPKVAEPLGRPAYVLALRTGGNQAAVDRFERELGRLGYEGIALEDDGHRALWRYVEEYTPCFLAVRPEAVVVRVSTTLRQVETVLESLAVPTVARAGTGVCYAHFQDAPQAAAWCAVAATRGWRLVIEYAPEEARRRLDLWPAPGSDFALLERLKNMFDPKKLLNRGRLYGRI